MEEKRKKKHTSFNIDAENHEKAKKNLEGAMDLNTFVNLCIAVVAEHKGATLVGELLENLKKR